MYEGQRKIHRLSWTRDSCILFYPISILTNSIMKTDAWKRPLPSAVDDCANVTSGYEQQLSFNFGTQVRDATPQEADEWFDRKLLQVVNRDWNV